MPIWDAPLPPNNRVPGQGEPAGDMNKVVDAIVEVRTEVDALPTGGGGGGGVSDVVTRTANATALVSTMVKADATAGALTITLDPAATKGKEISVMKTDSSVNAVTVIGSGATTINGQPSAMFTEQYAGLTAIHDGSNWLIRSVM